MPKIPSNTLAIIFTPTNWRIQIEDKTTGELIPTEDFNRDHAYSVTFILADGAQNQQFVISKKEVLALGKEAKALKIKTLVI